MSIPADGPLLGIDPGAKRMGVAAVGLLGIVTPVGMVEAQPEEEMLRALAALAEERDCVGIVVGLPLNMDGTEGPAARACRAIGARIAEATGLPVAFHDERRSSIAASRKLGPLGLTHKKRKAKLDAVAAATILESYLQAHRPSE